MSFISVILASCCFGNRKCNYDNNSASFRLIDANNGRDLVFGPHAIYESGEIQFYSLSNGDSIQHRCQPGANPNPGQDSLLYVGFDYSHQDTVFIRLNTADTDTLVVDYITIDGSPCCADYKMAKPVLYNQAPVATVSGGITIIRK